MLRLALVLALAALFALPACGGLKTGTVPADSEIKPWEAPEREELLEDVEGDDDDWGDLDEEEDEGHAPEPESEPEQPDTDAAESEAGASAAKAGSN